MQKKPSKLNILSAFCFLILAPLLTVLCVKLIDSKSYYIASVLIIICSFIPFFMFFEKKREKTGETVIISLLIALSVAGRCVMMFIPQVKPTCAIVVISAIAFGPTVGFLVGSLSMFLSNFIFGQGMFTPFQMLGMGLVGFICGLIFFEKAYSKNKVLISLTGGLLCFAIYGFITDTCSVLMFITDYSISSVLPIYLSGLSFNIIHGVATGIILFFICKPMAEKFSRLRIKYGIFSRRENI